MKFAWLFITISVLASSLALPQQTLPPRGIPKLTTRSSLSCALIPNWMKENKIVGGYNASTPIPWQVSIRSCQTGGCHYCGGTILDKSTVLTAAHCYEFLNTMDGHYVMAGTTERSDASGQTVAIDKIVRNDEMPYDSSSLDNDFLILKLKTPLTFNSNVKPACLPESSFAPNPGRMCFVSGWGKVAYGPGSLPETLQWVNVPLVSNSECSTKYQGVNRITDSMLCAGYNEGGKDSCQADSGGPLICSEGGKAILTGVVSYGIGCGTPNFPGVYARVTAVMSWMKSNMEIDDVNKCPSKIDVWWGDKYCDDFMNSEDCGFDGGDCCQDSPPRGWNSYCTECKCHKTNDDLITPPCEDIWSERKCKKKKRRNKCHRPNPMANCRETCGLC